MSFEIGAQVWVIDERYTNWTKELGEIIRKISDDFYEVAFRDNELYRSGAFKTDELRLADEL